MIRSLAVLALLAAAPTPVAAATTIAEVQAAFGQTRTLTARFTQTAQDGRVATGTLTLSRPGRLKFAYDKAPLLIVADGKRLYIVDYQVAQVSQYPIGHSPLDVLLQPSADLSAYAHVLANSPVPNRIAVEAADPKRADLGKLTLYLASDAAAPGGLALTGWKALDAQGNTTTIDLSDVRANVAVAKDAFAWRDPRGTRAPARN